ncbi:DUF4112 domain-containing protein [Halomicroarcula sp. GCM10025324]|jgi:hypothetical protein|uniref:DUF4112 domain-containing protein n=1 Tax=Haloarcula TaxID=2237 RepID=UPI0023E82B56|nr:DUF4112 domain-containing protein [Halomicroarcula sp. ZS-22-S1]
MSQAKATQSGTETVSSLESELDQALSIGERLDELENRAVWLDAEFTIPGTNIQIGVSSIVGALPGAGDGVMMLIAASIVYHGFRLGAPTKTLVWMYIVLLVEGVISIIPLLGDFIGAYWSANIQNVGYLREHSETLDGSTNWWFLVATSSPFILFVLLVVSLL